MSSLMQCSSCGGPVHVVSKMGAHLHIHCNKCDADNGSQIAAVARKLQKEDLVVVSRRPFKRDSSERFLENSERSSSGN